MKGFLIVTICLGQLIVSFTSAQQAGQTQPTCNSCCQGPVGSQGSPGSHGIPGTNGMSAFSAVRSTPFTISSSGQALPFERIHTNVGDDFDASTGQFTCQVPGIYIFTYSVATHSHGPIVCLSKNTDRINCVYRSTEYLYDVISNTAVLQLSVGDTVWLKCTIAGAVVYSNGDPYTSFSGAILHEM